MSETEEIEKLLKKMGWEHYLGQAMPGTKCVEVHHFLKGKDIIQVTLEEDVDDETLEAIRGIKMYAIIFWVKENIVKPLLNKDGSLTLFERLDVADKTAENIPESRVISIEGVNE